MRCNRVKKLLKKGEKVFGTMICDLRSPGVPQMLSTVGFDFVVFDGEHSGFSIHTIADQIIAARAAGITSVVRVPNRKYDHLLSRPLDVGAQGLLVPNVHTVDETKNIIKRTKYYPKGERGVALSRIHTDFISASAEEIMSNSNSNLLTILQIECKEAVENIEEIISVAGVDAAIVGPNDLSQSLGIPGQIDHPKEVASIRKVVNACKNHNVAPGIHVNDFELVEKWIEEGMQLIMYLSDISMIMKMANKAINDLNKIK